MQQPEFQANQNQPPETPGTPAPGDPVVQPAAVSVPVDLPVAVPPLSMLPVTAAVPRPSIWGPWPTVGLGAAIFMINGMGQSIVALVFAVLMYLQGGYTITDTWDMQKFLQDLIGNGDMLSLAIVVASVAGVAITIVFVRMRKGASLAEYLGLKAIGWKTFLILIGVYAVLFGISFGLGMVVKSDASGDIFTDAYRNTQWPVVFWLAIVLFGPVYEELLFRGFLFEGLRRSVLGIAGTIVLTGLVFALLHAAQYGASVIAQIFVLGITFGVVRWLTKSLWSTIFLHGLWNLGQMVIMVFFPTFGT
jgi:membrane protease YdiL (CAAX protease family)